MIWISGKSEFQGLSPPQQDTKKCHPQPSPALVSGQAAVTRQQKRAGEDAMVARQPLPGLTCHLPEVPGSHNPTGREAWTSGVWRVEYPGVRKLGERGKDGERHTWRHTDGPRQLRGWKE